MTYQEEENNHVEEVLHGYGIHTRNEETDEYLSVNEVMINVCRTLREIKETQEPKQYQIAKEFIMLALVGHRYRYDLI